jgi:hypothetical protein
MSERKDIERLFQEKFKDFEATPPPQVWETIASKLETKKNKRRIIPLWIKASGIAAGLIIGYFTIGNFTKFNQNNSVVNASEKEESSENYSNKTRDNQNTTNNQGFENNKTPNQNNAIVVTESNQENLEQKFNSNKTIVFSDKNNKKEQPFNYNNKNNKHNNDKIQLQNRNSKITDPKNNHSSLVISDKKASKESIVQNNVQSTKEKNILDNKNSNKTNSNTKEVLLEKASKELVVQNNTQSTKEKSILDNKNSNKTNSDKKEVPSEKASKELVVQNKEKPSNKKLDSNNKFLEEIFSESKNLTNSNLKNKITNSTKISIKDSVFVASAEENALDKILKEKEEKDKLKKVVSEKSSKWKLRPNLAPLVVNATEGSPISSKFVDNKKNFVNTASLGLGVDYAVNSKFAIRTGVNKFDFKYNTNEIVYYADLNAKNIMQNDLKTINKSPQAVSIIIEDKQDLEKIRNTDTNFSTETLELASQSKEEGSLNQQFGYIEVPVEVSYKLLDKKFGIQIITGLSTLFLNGNQVTLVSSEKTTFVGKANNLNNVHFSTNLGIGFKYSFLKSLEANFEPTLKYQINTFSDNSGGFKPYFIGFYTGLSFRF